MGFDFPQRLRASLTLACEDVIRFEEHACRGFVLRRGQVDAVVVEEAPPHLKLGLCSTVRQKDGCEAWKLHLDLLRVAAGRPSCLENMQSRMKEAVESEIRILVQLNFQPFSLTRFIPEDFRSAVKLFRNTRQVNLYMNFQQSKKGR